VDFLRIILSFIMIC